MWNLRNIAPCPEVKLPDLLHSSALARCCSATEIWIKPNIRTVALHLAWSLNTPGWISSDQKDSPPCPITTIKQTHFCGSGTFQKAQCDTFVSAGALKLPERTCLVIRVLGLQQLAPWVCFYRENECDLTSCDLTRCNTVTQLYLCESHLIL